MKFKNISQLIMLLGNQWKPIPHVQHIQWQKLKRLLAHAYANVPYYTDLFQSLRITPADIRSRDDFQELPLISKNEIASLPLRERVARNIDLEKSQAFSTSGTTGIPLTSYKEAQDATLMNLSWARAFLTSGMKPWSKMLAFKGQEQVSTQRKWHERFGLWPRKEISTWATVDEWIEVIKEWRPAVLIGYVMTLKILAEALQKTPDHDLGVKYIFHSSAILDPFSRQLLEQVLGAQVFDFYGSDEAGCIAFECKKCGAYHINSDMVLVEIVREGRPAEVGEVGEIVITNLHSYAQPYIRYRQVDIGTMSNKSIKCGRSFPLMDAVQGRKDDFIVLKNGQKLSPHPFYHCIDPVPGVGHWRITQSSIDLLTVEIVPNSEWDTHNQDEIYDKIASLVHDQIEIEICTVDKLPIRPDTKFRTVRSEVQGAALF